MSKPKIILITGGDMNNIDKGIIPASIGLLLKANGYNITVIKMDPCFNQNSSNLDPRKYGENYCLVDGEVASINFGYYERILNQIFTKINYITRGKVCNFANIENERRHLCEKIRSVNFIDATKNLIKNVLNKPIDGKFPDICIIELGGGVNGELSDKKFLQALSSEFKYKTEFLHVHISKFVGGELGFLEKSVQNLRNNNWKPDIIICRSTTPFSDVYKKHISHFAELNIDMVINLPDVPNVKWVPIKLQEQNIYNLITNELQLKKIGPNFEIKMNELKEEIKK
uniref:CTP synthase N-terminal domain-containing protein n=1 Tax=Panagrolaimus sp. PS1159 TaxID=55785 RepID=A0AC35GGW3_9BILA